MVSHLSSLFLDLNIQLSYTLTVTCENSQPFWKLLHESSICSSTSIRLACDANPQLYKGKMKSEQSR